MHQRRRIILLFGLGIVLPSLLLGYLAFRGVQNDRGNGACEVVYVTEFEILREANAAWRTLFKLSLVLVALSLATLFFL